MSLISDRRACAIPDPDNEEVIITGGGYLEDTLKTVSVYSESGWQKDLASLNQGRRSHGCGSYVNGGKKVIHIVFYHTCSMYSFNCQILLVTGGKIGSSLLDSTEIFSDNVWRTLTAKLPVPMDRMKVAPINNRVLLFGNSFFCC